MKELAWIAIGNGPHATGQFLAALQLPDGAGRSPFHLAASRFGSASSMFDTLIDAAHNLTVASGAPWHSAEGYLSALQPDAFGTSFSDYMPPLTEQKPVNSQAAAVNIGPRGEVVIEENGGWGISNWGRDSFWTGRCDVMEVSLSEAESSDLRPYMAMRRPVMIRGAGLELKQHHTLEKQPFVSMFGERMLSVSQVPDGNAFQKGASSDMTVREYVKYVVDITSRQPKPLNASLYSWDHWLVSEAEDALDQSLPLIDRTQAVMSAALWPAGAHAAGISEEPPHYGSTFFLGPPGSGMSWQYHDGRINSLAYGQTRWFLRPPGEAEFSMQPTVEWFKTEYDRRRPGLLECVQTSGDLLVLPRGWSHASINIDTAIGVQYEFSFMAPGTTYPILH